MIGRPLVRQLAEAGHEVVGTTRSEQRAETIRALGAEPVVVDATDTDALRAVVIEARPEVVINQLTNLPDKLDYKRAEETFGPTNELRGKVGPALAGAAAEAGARRLISQSVCFFYASTGKPEHDEDDPLIELPPDAPAGQGTIALEALERSTRGDAGPRGRRAPLRVLLRARARRTRLGWSLGRGRPPAPLPDRRQGDRDLLLHATSTTRPRRRSRRSSAAPGSTTSATTSPRRCRSGCRPTRRRSAPSRRAGSRSGWRSLVAGKQAAGHVHRASRAPRTRRRSGSSAGSRGIRAGGRASARRWLGDARRCSGATIAVPVPEDRRQQTRRRRARRGRSR